MGATWCTDLGSRSLYFSRSLMVADAGENREIGRRVSAPELQTATLMPTFNRPSAKSMPDLLEHKPQKAYCAKPELSEHKSQEADSSKPELYEHKSSKSDVGRKHKHKHAPSLMDRLKDREKNPVDQFIEGEEEAEIYVDDIQKNSIMNMSETLNIANSMIEKENDVIDELKRQREVTSQANHDIHITEQEIEDTNYMLKGMQSYVSKLVRKKPKIVAYDGLNENSLIKTNKKRDRLAPLPVQKYVAGQDKQDWIQGSVTQLSSAMDIIKGQQLDIKDELEHQEENLEKFGNNIDRIEKKIKNQTHLMNSFT